MSKHEHKPVQPKYRILCIDGGGILGTFPASFLATLEGHLDHPIGSYFDLIVGTSTGGILAIGLAMGLSASDILALYEKRGPEIFGEGRGRVANTLSRCLRWIRHWYQPKHDSDRLRAVLDEVLKGSRIGDAQTRLVIPAWDSVSRNVYIYKTAHHPRLRMDYQCSAVDAALATSAAPTYFRHHITQHDVGLLDGGVWANNPIGVAVVEAIAVLGWPRESLHILSLGCLEETYTVPKWAGVGTLGKKAIKLFMDGQSRGAMGMAKLITGDEHERRDAIFRIDHTVPYSVYKMDDTHTIPDLKGLGHAKAREWQPQLEPIFFHQPAEPFQPVYKLNEVLTCQ